MKSTEDTTGYQIINWHAEPRFHFPVESQTAKNACAPANSL